MHRYTIAPLEIYPFNLFPFFVVITRESQVNLDHQDLRVFKALQVLKVTMGDPVHPVILDHLEILAPLGFQDQEVILV